MIIGAGIAGCTLARRLADAGQHVVVLDKARGPGGRTATRRDEQRRFDHGAPFIRTNDTAFREHLDAWCDAGVIAPWVGRFATPGPRWTGFPAMNELCKALLDHDAIELRTQTTAARLASTRGWTVLNTHDSPIASAPRVVVTAPAAQARDLLAGTALAARITADHDPCWTAVLGFASPLTIELDTIDDCNGPIASAVRNNAKPGRHPEETWVVHAGAAWSAEHLELEPAQVLPLLISEFAELAMSHGAGPMANPDDAIAHRWRYAHVRTPMHETHLFDNNLGVCGDWCGPIEPGDIPLHHLGVQRAWHSAMALAGAMRD